MPDETTPKKAKFEILPTFVDGFDELLFDGGLERGTTILVVGGAGTGKTTFCMQSLYCGALRDQTGVYISFEEDPEKIRFHLKKNYGWDFYKLDEKNLVKLIKIDPTTIARKVEEELLKERGLLRITMEEFKLPIESPDRIVVDSLSALSIAFRNEDNYRKYIRELFEMLEKHLSVNFVVDETEQNPTIYSRTGIEEFLADGVIVLYNIKMYGKRRNALEILKLRSGGHVKEMMPYSLTKKGFLVQSK